MTTPKRIQRQRTKGWKMPGNTVYVGRPTYFGNPFDGVSAANAFRRWMDGRMGRAEFNRRKRQTAFALWSDKHNIEARLPDLRGKHLACWCKPEDECHADVLLELANS